MNMVVFDLDDTLYPEVEFVRAALRAAGDHLDRLLGRATHASRVFVQVMEQEGVHEVFQKGLARIGVEASAPLMAELVAAYRNCEPPLSLYPGVRELLSTLRAQRRSLGLLTDGPLALQRAKVRALGLSDTFDVVVFTDALGGREFYKPHPAGFIAVERASGLSGPAITMVGDRPLNDLVPAAARGWRTIRVRHAGGFHATRADPDPARPVANSVRDLARLLGCGSPEPAV